jgi:transcriptional regulator with XRE-family HTH domain
MTQERFGDLINISRHEVSRLERGADGRSPSRPITAAALAVKVMHGAGVLDEYQDALDGVG